jgi:hypothetical protein
MGTDFFSSLEQRVNAKLFGDLFAVIIIEFKRTDDSFKLLLHREELPKLQRLLVSPLNLQRECQAYSREQPLLFPFSGLDPHHTLQPLVPYYWRGILRNSELLNKPLH